MDRDSDKDRLFGSPVAEMSALERTTKATGLTANEVIRSVRTYLSVPPGGVSL